MPQIHVHSIITRKLVKELQELVNIREKMENTNLKTIFRSTKVLGRTKRITIRQTKPKDKRNEYQQICIIIVNEKYQRKRKTCTTSHQLLLKAKERNVTMKKNE